jgi:TATA-box binding protein (TBP) (component of TFIID and TFIIIB)
MSKTIKEPTYKDYINLEEYNINNLPVGVSVSTMCVSCKLGTNINTDNIYNYMQLSANDIITIKKDNQNLRTLPIKLKKNNKAVKKTFYNQITIVVRIDDCDVEVYDSVPKINVKLFKNGSIQMSGCKTMESINIVLNKIVHRLQEINGVLDITTKEIKAVQYVEEIEVLDVNFFKIDMINSNYKINLVIDRKKLYDLLISKKIKCSYERCIRACVIVKYMPEIDNIEKKDISIFIFRQGNIIITGAKKVKHIIASYNFINNIIKTNKYDIQEKDITNAIHEAGLGHLLSQMNVSA